jgi:hypothetical protein
MRIYIERVRLDRQGYTKSGQYFGVGAPLFRYSGEDPDAYYEAKKYIDDYIRAASNKEARVKIMAMFPKARFTGKE